MSTSLHDLARRASAVPVPDLDTAALIAAGERRLRRRTALMTAGSALAVLALVGGALLLVRQPDPAPAPIDVPRPDREQVDPSASDRQLTYAAGRTIHYGGRTIDAGGLVHELEATDDGVVFVRGRELAQSATRDVFFTDGRTTTRIGSASGSPGSGYGIHSGVAGSLVVWLEESGEPSRWVVYDTRKREPLTTLDLSYRGNPQLLGVHDDAVYWAPDGDACVAYRTFADCPAAVRVWRYDARTGATRRVPAAAYHDERDSRGRTLAGSYSGTPGSDEPGKRHPVVYTAVVFLPDGNRLVVDGGEPREEYDDTTLTSTGAPVRLRLAPDTTSAPRLALSQWLDDDRMVLFGYTGGGGTELADAGDIITCSVSRGDCQLTHRGKPGEYYELPGLD